jgi:hypothetical protein
MSAGSSASRSLSGGKIELAGERQPDETRLVNLVNLKMASPPAEPSDRECSAKGL